MREPTWRQVGSYASACRRDDFGTVRAHNVEMAEPRRAAVYVIRIWQEPSHLVPPGEWRGSLRPIDGSQSVLFKSAEELWRHLTGESTSPAGSTETGPDLINWNKGESA